MTLTFSKIRTAPASRFLGVFCSLLVVVWFILPSCSCQWDLLFGNPTQIETSTSPTFKSAGTPVANHECHCEDASFKTFEHHNRLETPTHQAQISLLPADQGIPVLSAILRNGTSTRGPPAWADLPHFAELRVFLRHRTFLI